MTNKYLENIDVAQIRRAIEVEEKYNNMKDADIPMYHIPFNDFKKEKAAIFLDIIIMN